MTMNFWELLHQREGSLTRSGRTVAEYLIQNPDEAQYLSISSMAKRCGVAEATVFRFCRALGFEGYHEMRISLAQANATGALNSYRELMPGATTQSLCDYAHGTFLAAINGTQNSLSPQAIEQSVELMQAARQVFFFGQGGSMLLANDLCSRFATLSPKFRTAGDSHLQLITTSLLGPEDVILYVSYSGGTHDALDTLQTARSVGAKVILLTHYEDSPAAALADVVLLCGAKESPLESGSLPVKVAVLYVGETLLLRYKFNDPDAAAASLTRTSHAISAKFLQQNI